MWGNHSFAACGNVVMMCDGKKYNPQGVVFSLALLPRVGCVALANPALSKVQPRCGNGWIVHDVRACCLGA